MEGGGGERCAISMGEKQTRGMQSALGIPK